MQRRLSGQEWFLTGLVALVAVLATLLVQSWLTPRYAFAQASEGSAGYTVAVVGPAYQNRLPLFLIDNKAQVVMVYDWDQSRRKFFLRTVRSFRNDRRLEDENFGEKSATRGPSVKDVEKRLRD